MKRSERRKKNKFKKILIVFLIICIIGIIVYFLLNVKTKNIVILNNDYYSDEEIIETANIENYPEFILLNTNNIKNKLKKLDLIEDVSIRKKWGFILEIDVKESSILYYVRSKEEYMASNYKTYNFDNINGVPTLINFVPENVEKQFVKGFSKIDKNIISLISEIEYSKTAYDEKRFLLYMNDGNEVYITVGKINLLNKYVDIVKKLSNKNGILYLDSGNYFEIKK